MTVGPDGYPDPLLGSNAESFVENKPGTGMMDNGADVGPDEPPGYVTIKSYDTPWRTPLVVSYDPDPMVGMDAQADAYWSKPGFLPDDVRQFIIDSTNAYYGYKTQEVNHISFWRFVFGQAAVNNSSVYDVVGQLLSSQGKGSGDAGGGGGGGGPSTLMSYDFTSPQMAKNIVDASLKAYLGRAATQDEVQSFIAALRAEEQANPTVVTQSGGSQTRTGGFDAEAFARDYAMQQEGAAEYQAATKYLDLFLGALG